MRPHVWLNCAVSTDGRLAYAGGRRAALSGPEDLARVQRIRASVQGIVVGVGTVIADDPSLRVHWDLVPELPRGPAPTRIVLDSTGRTPSTSRVLDGSAPTVVATTLESQRTFPPHVTTISVGSGRVDLPALLEQLAARGMRSLMVEGGAAVIASFLRAGLVDRLTVYTSPLVIGGRTAPPMATGPETRTPSEAIGLALERVEPLGEGFVATYAPRTVGTAGAQSRQ